MYTILKISIAKLLHKPFSSALSVLLFAIGVTLISLIIKTETFINNQYRTNLAGIDLVVGAKGSPLQLILSSVLHVDAPTGNIALSEVEKIENNPLVKKTIPISLGDSYKGYRIVGTNIDYLKLYKCDFSSGNNFEKALDAVIGSEVAKKTGLHVGSTFAGVHGFVSGGHSHKKFKYTVTGVLNSSGNITDNLIITPTESVWLVHEQGHHEHGDEEHVDEHEHIDEHENDEGHEHREEHEHVEEHAHGEHHGHVQKTSEQGRHTNKHDEVLEQIKHKISHGEELSAEEAQMYNEHKGQLVLNESEASENITALLVFFKNPMAAVILPRAINQNTNLQAASPVIEMNRLISLLGFGFDTIRLLAWIIIIISSFNIFIYLLNLFNQSIYEISLIRLAGASRLKVVAMLYFQGIILAVSGWIVGIIASVIVWQFLPQYNFNVDLDSGVIQKEIILLLYCIGIGLFVAIVPALRAYRNNIHFTLSR